MFRIKGVPYCEEGNKLYFKGIPQTTYKSFPNPKSHPISPLKDDAFHVRLTPKTTYFNLLDRDIPRPDLKDQKISILCKTKKYAFKSQFKHNEGKWVKGWHIMAVKVNFA